MMYLHPKEDGHGRRQGRYIDGKILMTPTGQGESRHYVATLRGDSLAILGEIPSVTNIGSPTGNRTESDTWMEVRVALHLQFGARQGGPAVSQKA